MSAEEVLRTSERSASNTSNADDEAILSRVTGYGRNEKKLKRLKSFGALGLVTLLIIILLLVFSSGNLIPAAISERLVEATDVQYADAVESKILVFQQALRDGNIPDNTKNRLSSHGVEISGSSIIYKGETISAENFSNKVHSDASLYAAFNASTYDRAAYYYDDAAEAVFRKLGTTRDNYSANSSFNEVMSRLVGSGSDIDINNVGIVEKERENGEKYEDYDLIGEKADSNDLSADDFVAVVAKNNLDTDGLLATLDATVALNNADVMLKEQKSSIFFLAFMENISKMKAGAGNDSKINDAMNYLFRESESSVVDTKTGELVTTKGSMLESPSLYAILSGSQVDQNKVVNYASDRLLKTVEGKLGVGSIDNEIRNDTITSTGTKNRGAIGRFLEDGNEVADLNTLSVITPTINSSAIDNSFDSISGIYGGELLVEGAVNVGKMLAKSSGATAGDSGAIRSYAKVSSSILALDAEVDRMNRSPFDISSPNTFLGSIVHKIKTGKFFTPVFADDNKTQYLSNFGETCETLNSIGAEGSVGCSEIATFDTSTLDDPFYNSDFVDFVEENTTMENGVRKVKEDSDLANFIKYNNERITPLGVMDGGILDAIKNNSSSLSFISNIISLIKAWLGASDEEKDMATGKIFVNSSSNSFWSKYKYAQRYVSLARATDALRQYDGDETAYNNIPFFEGKENPVVAFLNEYYNKVAISK